MSQKFSGPVRGSFSRMSPFSDNKVLFPPEYECVEPTNITTPFTVRPRLESRELD